ncbi:MAG: helix-turn-helix transcriptional regulator [Vicinamibacterales bacterium]|nr:helix-turn-helix transcriptional regulator [Vicinamibacterales bacterium]
MRLTGSRVQRARREHGWTQAVLARRLRVSQGYVSLMEADERAVPAHMARRLAKLFEMGAGVLPHRNPEHSLDATASTSALGALGHPGFAHVAGRTALNPAELLLRTLRSPGLEARVLEALVWVVRHHASLDWDWLLPLAKQHDAQNRLGFVLALARGLAERAGDATTAATLRAQEDRLEPSVLRKEDDLGCPLTASERRWLLEHRPLEAVRWNVLSNLTAKALADE